MARCTKIINAAPKEVPKEGAKEAGAKDEKEDQTKYVINVKQIAKFVVALGDKASPTDIEEGMRVGYANSDATLPSAHCRSVLIATNIKFRFLFLRRLTLPSL